MRLPSRTHAGPPCIIERDPKTQLQHASVRNGCSDGIPLGGWEVEIARSASRRGKGSSMRPLARIAIAPHFLARRFRMRYVKPLADRGHQPAGGHVRALPANVVRQTYDPRGARHTQPYHKAAAGHVWLQPQQERGGPE